MKDSRWQGKYLRLHRLAALKRLEATSVYHIGRDNLYEIDESALAFLTRCDGSAQGAELTSDKFVAFCLTEELLENTPAAGARSHPRCCSARSFSPLSRVQLTRRCNLRCRHCYLGPARPVDLPLADAIKIAGQFSCTADCAS